jgi:voltage-gated sodium channel
LRLSEIVESNGFRRAVIAVILVNAVHIGLETDPGMVARYGALLRGVDRAVLGLFSLEMTLRLLAASPVSAFFRDPWNWFDCAVIGAGFFPGSEFLTVFRLLRILRLMRTLRILPGLKHVADAVFETLPSLTNVLVILSLLFYTYATAGALLYGPLLPEKFGSLGRSLLTLCEVITLEGWGEPMRLLLPKAPFAWVYFISFILLGTYFALSSVVQILVNHLLDEDNRAEIAEIRRSLARIEAQLKRE